MVQAVQNQTTQSQANYIPRLVEPMLIDSLARPFVTMITGARQVGKSTLLERLVKHAQSLVSGKLHKTGVIETRVFYYTLDDIPLRAQLKKDITYIQKDIELAIGTSIFSINKKVYVFIDEIQKFLPLLDWIKQVYDRNSANIKFVITGSSVTGFTKKLTETLAGRIEFVHLYPLVLLELLQKRFNFKKGFWQLFFEAFASAGMPAQAKAEKTGKSGGAGSASKTSASAGSFDPTYMLDALNQTQDVDVKNVTIDTFKTLYNAFRTDVRAVVGSFLESLFFGGMPKVYQLPPDQRQAILSNYINVYLEKEIGYIARNIDLELFGLSLASFARFNAKPINIQEIAKQVGIARSSIYKYLDLLEQTFLVQKLYAYPTSLKNINRTLELAYLDTGLLNVLLNISSPKDLTTSLYLPQILTSYLLTNLMAVSSLLGLNIKPHYLLDYDDHKIDLVFDYRNLTIGFINDPMQQMDMRKMQATVKLLTKASGQKTVLVIKPTWDVTNMSLDYNITYLEELSESEFKGKKQVYLLEAPYFYFV